MKIALGHEIEIWAADAVNNEQWKEKRMNGRTRKLGETPTKQIHIPYNIQ